MRVWTKWSERALAAACGRCTTAHRAAPSLKKNKKAVPMPSKGYRKGISDGKTPLPRQVYFRTSTEAWRDLTEESGQRSMTTSELARQIIEAHLRRQRATLPHRTLNSAVVRELTRIGNNLNQVAHQANLMHLHLIESEARLTLAAVLAAVRRL